MKEKTLLFLRISIGLLLVVWGLDKFANPDHAIQVSEAFYFGLLSAGALQPVFGAIEIALGAAVIAGVWRKYTYPALLVVLGVSLLVVWRSVLDPWGWYLGDTNVFFFPSLIIFAGALVLYAFQDEDTMVVGGKKAAGPAPSPGPGM